MIDHMNVNVRDLEGAKRFYAAALQPFGYELMMEYPGVAGFGREGKPDFWLAEAEAGAGIHVAFAAPDRATVDAFHKAALGADGNNVEAVCHRPE